MDDSQATTAAEVDPGLLDRLAAEIPKPSVGWIVKYGLALVGLVGAVISWHGWYDLGVLIGMSRFEAGALPLLTDVFGFIVGHILFVPFARKATKWYAGLAILFAILLSGAANGISQLLTNLAAQAHKAHQLYTAPGLVDFLVVSIIPIMVGIVVHQRAMLSADAAAEHKRLVMERAIAVTRERIEAKRQADEELARAERQAAAERERQAAAEREREHREMLERHLQEQQGNPAGNGPGNRAGNGSRETGSGNTGNGRRSARSPGAGARRGNGPAAAQRILPPKPDLPEVMDAAAKIDIARQLARDFNTLNPHLGPDARIRQTEMATRFGCRPGAIADIHATVIEEMRGQDRDRDEPAEEAAR